MIIDLPITERPWQIGTPPPRDRYVEIAALGTVIVAHYLADGDCFLVTYDCTIPRAGVDRWREASPETLDQLNAFLASN